MIDQNILSYVAGFVDGDGCFAIRTYKQGKQTKHTSQLIVTSTSQSITQFLANTLGGSWKLSDKRERFPNQNPNYRFCICGQRAANIAEDLIPFLKEKRDQALCFINFTNFSDPVEKATYINQMNQLKHGQPAITRDDIANLKQVKHTITLKEIDFPYIAGFIDAECSLCLHRYKSKHRPNWIYKSVLMCNNTRLPTIEFLIRALGGAISFVAEKRTQSSQISWKMSGKRLKLLLPNVFPFLRIKHAVCKKIMNFHQIILPNGGARHTDAFRRMYATNLLERDLLFKEIHSLNKRGVKVI